MTDEIRDNISINESKINEEIIKKHDKNYHVYRRDITLEEKGKNVNKILKLGLYSSVGVGSSIRDAVTGIYYNYKT